MVSHKVVFEFSDNAYSCDPRIQRFKEEEKEKKEAQKRAKKEAARKKAEEEDRVSGYFTSIVMAHKRVKKEGKDFYNQSK